MSQYSVAGGQTFILGSLGTTFVVLYMIPSPAHETPLEWVGSPRNTPLPCILLVFGASWHIHPCNAHTKVKFPTYDRFLHTHTDIYIYKYYIYIYKYYIYNPLYTPDQPSCYILCLHTTYILSTCYIFTIYALST